MSETTKVVNGSATSDSPNVVATRKESNTSSLQRANDLTQINLLDEGEIAKAKVFLQSIMRSEKGGVKSVEDGLAIIMRAKDLNIPFSTSLEHVHVINGKTGIDIHIIKALLSKAGVTWGKPIKDYAPLYEYTDGYNVFIEGNFPDGTIKCRNIEEAKALSAKDTENFYVYPVRYYQSLKDNGIYKDYTINNTFAIVSNGDEYKKAIAEGKHPIRRIPNKPVDFVTEYELTRYIDTPDGIKKTTSIGRFSYSEALAAGMFDKDTYKKYPKVLIAHRAFTYAARDIASDIILGAYETSELHMINDIEPDEQYIIEAQTVE